MNHRLESFIGTGFNNEPTRTYVLCHTWLSPIQKGVQATHAVADMIARHSKIIVEEANQLYYQTVLGKWVYGDKTLILLEGGNSQELSDFYSLLTNSYITGHRVDNKDKIFFSKFHEDTESLNSSITAVAVVLPESIYNYGVTCEPRPIHNYHGMSEEKRRELEHNYRINVAMHEIFEYISTKRLAS